MENKNNLHFFLGGNDLEMKTIKDLLEKQGVAYSDANLGWWNANVSSYEEEIKKVATEGKTPVIVELATEDDKGNPLMTLPDNTINIDHHNKNAGRSASILQICDLLGVEPTRRDLLVAANDVGMAKAMREMGATETEINKIRYQDRACQGITPEQEEQAIEALSSAKEIGGILFVTCEHSKTATILDRLDRDQYPDVFMYSRSDKEINFSGDGYICAKLVEKFPHPYNFSGGNGFGKKGEMAYWGGSYADVKEAAKFVIKENFEKQQDKTATPQMDVAALKALTDFKFEK